MVKMSDNMTGHNKTAVITGGSSGIGFAIASRLSEDGFTCILIGRNRLKLEEACRKMGNNSYCFPADLTDLSAIPALVREIALKFGHIDVLVNNAGIHLKKPAIDVTDEEYHRVILTNQTSVFVLTRETAKLMAATGGGSVINISSMASHYGLPGVIAYAASKSAVEGMTRTLAVELARYNIRVNCIAPGFIKTDMSSSALDSDPSRKERVLARTPMARLGKPSEVADAVSFLVSEAAAFITGIVMPVDGGNSIGF